MAAAVTGGLARADNSVHRGARRGIGVQVYRGRWLRPGSLSTSLQELFDGGLFDLPAVRVLH